MVCTDAQRRRGREHYWRNHAKRLVQMKLWRDSHRDYRAVKHREWRANHPDYGTNFYWRHRTELLAKAKEQRRIWREQHPRPRPRISREERLARERLHREANRDSINAARRERYQINKAKENLRCKLYRERNRDALRARGRARYWREHDKSIEWSRRSYRTHRTKRLETSKRYRTNPATRPVRLAQKRRYYERTHGRKSVEWRAKRHERRKRKLRTYARQQSKQLTNAYVRKLLCRGTTLKPNDFSPEIVRIARMKVRLLRAAGNNTTTRRPKK